MIKFLDLHKIKERFRDEIDARIKQVLDSGWYLLGKQDKIFEQHFAQYCGVKHCIGCANGLDALNLIIRAYGFGKDDEIILPQAYDEKAHVWHIFGVRINNREEFQKYLTENEIQTLIHYPTPPHKQEAYKEWNSLSYPITEKIHNEILSLPISPVMSDEEVKKVVEVVNAF